LAGAYLRFRKDFVEGRQVETPKLEGSGTCGIKYKNMGYLARKMKRKYGAPPRYPAPYPDFASAFTRPFSLSPSIFLRVAESTRSITRNVSTHTLLIRIN